MVIKINSGSGFVNYVDLNDRIFFQFQKFEMINLKVS